MKKKAFACNGKMSVDFDFKIYSFCIFVGFYDFKHFLETSILVKEKYSCQRKVLRFKSAKIFQWKKTR